MKLSLTALLAAWGVAAWVAPQAGAPAETPADEAAAPEATEGQEG